MSRDVLAPIEICWLAPFYLIVLSISFFHLVQVLQLKIQIGFIDEMSF